MEKQTQTLTADDIEVKIKDLISKMTLKEKIGQLMQESYASKSLDEYMNNKISNGLIGSLFNVYDVNMSNTLQKLAMEKSRLKIPLLIGKDIIHGSKTILPIPLGQAATFNPDIVEEGARVAAIEGSAIGVRWTFSPMLDIARDPRWGRIAEGSGQDPYLGSKMAAAMVQGYQTKKLNDLNTMAACAKHYIGYGVSEGGRDYNTTYIPQNLLRDIYLPPFKEAIKSNVLTVMSGFNDLNGIPASGNQFTLKTILREELLFNGIVVSDWCSISELVPQGYAQNYKDAAIKAIKATVDMQMASSCYIQNLQSLLSEGKVSIHDIQVSVANILRVKFKMGLFENYYTDPARQSQILTEKNKAIAKSIALQSAVLLQNRNKILPLNKSNLKSLAVIGPLANDAVNQIGCWGGDGSAKDCITPYTSLKQYLPNTTINYAQGLLYPRSPDTSLFQQALNAAKISDIVLMIMGQDNKLSGQTNCRTNLGLPGAQFELIDQISKLGKPIVLVIYAGRSLVLTNILPLVDSVLFTFHLGTMAGPAIADLLLGVVSPSGRLPVSFLKTLGQLPVYYNKMNTGRPSLQKYIQVDSQPLFPFGFGLTYSKFTYSNVRLSKTTISSGESLMATVTLKNQGTFTAQQVVQLFVRDLVGSYTRPVKQLKGFKKVSLRPGDNTNIVFIINFDDLAFWTAQNKWAVESGTFTLWIGPNACEGQSINFTVKL